MFAMGLLNYEKEVSTTFEIKKRLDDDFQNLAVVEAKNAIYKRYGSESINAQRQLYYLIQNIVTANAQENEILKYTLDNAYSLAYHIFTCVDKQRGVDRSNCMSIAKKALNLVANAYANNHAYFQALTVIRCLNPNDAITLQQGILNRWENYIEKCPPHTKAAEQFMYETQLKSLMKV